MIKYIDEYLRDDYYFFTHSDEFIGKHIFKSNGSIGDYLGAITEIRGPNRIFYHNSYTNKNSYLAYRTIGLICDNMDDVQKLFAIKKVIYERNQKFQKEVVAKFQQEISSYKNAELRKIVENYDPKKNNRLSLYSAYE